MGAMMRFRQETGADIRELTGTDTADVLTFLWCCVASACSVDGVDFPLSALDMADRMSMDDFAAWQGVVAGSGSGEAAPPAKKKRSP
jgi:hypothetical protein